MADSHRAAEEQAALRRIATLVACETAPDKVFAAVAREVGEILDVDATHMGRYDPDGTVVSLAQWGRYPGVPVGTRFSLEGDSASARVLRTGRATRMEAYADAEGVIAATLRELGIRSSIAVPISVEGRIWGVMIATSKSEAPFTAGTESRLQDFTELLAMAISNASARDNVRALADEQGALRRVATLVAQQTPEAEVFAAVAAEIGQLLGVDSIEIARYGDDSEAVVVAGWGRVATAVPVGTRVALGGRNVTSLVFATGRAARLDDYALADGPIGERVRAESVRCAVATPIVVEGRLWGAMIAAHVRDEAIPADIESRLAQFTELMATAIANAAARSEVARLADEQAALRRVATLVAQGAPPEAVFEAVTAEAANVLGAAAVALGRYEDAMLTVLASRGPAASYVRAGERVPLDGMSASATVRRTGQTARVDRHDIRSGAIAEIVRRGGVRSTVAAPVMVDGRTWGVLAASWTDRGPPPDDAERRLGRFAELLDIAIGNADARDQLTASRDQLTASRARVLAAGDEARRRVVRDLHDGAQQRLVHTIVTLQLAQRALTDDELARAVVLIAEGLENVERANAELRELAHGILPSVLSRGLRAGVTALASRLELPVEIDIDISAPRLPADIEASAYFIIAEALTNVVKHAHATRARVAATIHHNQLAIEIHDDGIGGADPHGSGLLGIADRVEALGGQLDITTRDGTTLGAQLPLPDHPGTPAEAAPRASLS